MKKNMYVTPEMEVVEMTGLCAILADSDLNAGGPIGGLSRGDDGEE